MKDSGIFSLMAFQAINSLGYDAERVFQRCGLTPEQLNNLDLRTPHEGQQIFWQVLEQETNDPHIGLHLGEHLPLFRGQVIEYLFLSSSTFGDGLVRANSFMRLLSDAVTAKLGEHQGEVYVNHSFVKESPHQLIEAGTVGMIKFFSHVTEGTFKATKVWFSHSSNLPLDEYERILGCPVELKAVENRIFFKKEVLKFPSSHAEPELLKLHEKYANAHLARLEKQDLVLQVNRVIAELLESGDASLESVAAKLGIKPRNLRSRLSDANTNFNQVMADYRCYLAKRLLARTDESIDEIVYLTGFSEPSTFYRAFKRWVGMTPIEYRKMKKLAAQ